MPAEFRLLWQESGFNDPPYLRSTMLIPHGEISLVLMQNAGSDKATSDGKLDITELARDKAVSALGDYLTRFMSSKYSKRSTLESALSATIQHTQTQGGKLLAVKGRDVGSSVLKAGKASQAVVVAGKRDISLAFRFLRSLDADKKLLPKTAYDFSEAAGWVSELNWIFGAQANILFNTFNTGWVDAPFEIPTYVDPKMLKEHITPKKDGSSNLTVFLVGKWKPTAGGSHMPQDSVVALEDHPKEPRLKPNVSAKDSLPTDKKYDYVDSFILVLAHEVAHFAAQFGGHFDNNPNVLLSSAMQTTVIIPDLQSKMNPWGKKR